ncbi:MAG: hypothetical protein HWD62_08245 [Cyclobacteriaceae bacterium]|nr:MAG: hypothetical protein HWD62_08245 [Cyclobacteriaceae bacterium]
MKDLTKDVKPTEGNNLIYKADLGGTYLFTLISNDAYIEQEGKAFNAYLEEDGLDYILDQRKKSNSLDKNQQNIIPASPSCWCKMAIVPTVHLIKW